MDTTANNETDRSGRDRFGRNVAFAWGGYLVNVVSGFIVPRLISDQLGQATLGIWDFCWSLVSYFGLVQLGMGSSVARYVAKFRARDDRAGLNRSVSTIALFLRSVGWLAFGVAAVVAFWVLPHLSGKLGEGMDSARWIILLLGLQVSAGITLTVYGSVIVGCHRWDVHNAVSASCYGLIAVGSVTALTAGAGLAVLAAIHCVVMTAGELARRYLSRRVCPELVIDRRLASWKVFAEQARYSAKSLSPRIAALLSNQALAILITLYLGPASLAIFARPRSLMSTLRVMAAKFGMILIPTSSALSAMRDEKGLEHSLVSMTSTISALVLPPLVVLAIFGDRVIRLWMGPEYVFPGLVPILALGCLATVVQEPVWALLSGMNAHGRMALAKLVAAAGSATLLALGLGLFDWGLLGAAVCFVLPQILVDGILTPWCACTRLGVSRRTFAWKVFGLPAVCILPAAAALAGASNLAGDFPLAAAALAAAGLCGSAVAYGKWLVSPALMSAAVRRLQRRGMQEPASSVSSQVILRR